ncbi:MAG: hypothetical protein U0324_02315 [Polyangiales bacterium]
MTTRTSLQPVRADATAARRVRDPYADLLRDTRGIKREQAAARDAWFAGLALEGKEEALFELEMLLKGVVAWGDARNHPVARGRAPLRERDFAPHLAAARAAVARALALAARLGGARRPRPLARGLAPAAVDEPRADVGETPEQALLSLEQGLRAALAALDGLLAGGRVPHRTFLAATLVVQREVARNAFFNPLFALEFRPEFDRVRVPDVLDAILSVEGDVAHRFVALAYLGALRLLRLAGLARAAAAEPAGLARAWPLAAALRADVRALAAALSQRAPALLTESLERDLMRVPAAEMRARFDAAARECERVRRLQSVFSAAAATLRAESRRLVLAGLPDCAAGPPRPGDAEAAVAAAERVGEALQALVVQLTWALRGGADPERIFGDRAARRTASAHLREGAWMFGVVTRAFLAQAAATPTDDAWRDGPDLAFARDYLAYFRAIGRAVAHETDYPHTERLAAALSALRDVDWVDAHHLAAAVAEAELFAAHLQRALDAVGQRDELRDVALDRPRAAETLRMHLGAALTA